MPANRNNTLNKFWLLAFLLFMLTVSTYVDDVFASDNVGNKLNELEKITSQLPQINLDSLGAVIVRLEAFPATLASKKDAEKASKIVLNIFEELLAGKLYYLKDDNTLVSVEIDGHAELSVREILSTKPLANIKKQDIEKVRTNNKLRKVLRETIAGMTLFSSDAALRKKAVNNLMNNLDENNIQMLTKARERETKPGVLQNIDTALFLWQLESAEPETRKQAANALSGTLEPVVRNRLSKFLLQNSEGDFLEPDKGVRLAAEKSLERIEAKRKFYNFIETMFFGLSLGSVLLLIAIGLSITFGVMGVINMAHGELIMLGAYTTYVLQQLMPNNIGASILLAIPVAFLVSGLAGVLIERGVIQFLKGRPLETLLATFGISLVLQQAVRSIFSPLNRQVKSPEWMSGALDINPVLAITYNRLYVVVFSLLVFAVLLLIMKRTVLGLYVRAVSQNRDMAKAMGIRGEWVDAMTFGLGSGIAGVAGVALSQLTNVGPNLGQAYIIDSFMVVVFGGVGNLWGTLVGGFTLGVANKFLEPAVGAVLAKIIVLIFIILFIQKRPSGLFPQKGRAAE